MAIAAVVSALVNVLYILLVHADQRVIVLLMLSVVGGLILLAGERSGAFGMGLILGAVLAVVIVAIFGFAGWWDPLSNPDPRAGG